MNLRKKGPVKVFASSCVRWKCSLTISAAFDGGLAPVDYVRLTKQGLAQLEQAGLFSSPKLGDVVEALEEHFSKCH